MQFIKKLLIIIRAYSLTTSGLSVILGTTLAVVLGNSNFNFINFLLALIGMMLLHSAANIFADIYDYKKGIDTEVLPGCGAVVAKLITIKEAYLWVALTTIVGVAIGLYLTFTVSFLILYVGIAGVLIGFLYTAFGYGLKYNALGDLSVFFNFGMLGTLGAWIVQTGEFSWLPLLWGLPSSLLVVAVLQSNNWRDIERDTEVGAVTVASIIGDKASEKYYYFLVFTPFILVILYILAPRLFSTVVPSFPYLELIVFFAMPQALKLQKISLARKNKETEQRFLTILEETAKLHFLFTLFMVVGLLIHQIIK